MKYFDGNPDWDFGFPSIHLTSALVTCGESLRSDRKHTTTKVANQVAHPTRPWPNAYSLVRKGKS